MRVVETEIPDVKIVFPPRFADPRGMFSETYNRASFAKAGIDSEYVQDNHSISKPVGTIRGLHFQTPPFAQEKLVRVVHGKIFDVAVDIRKNSPTFGKHVARVISAEEWNQFLVPVGFAHGFCTLEPDTEVIYKVTNYYAPECERGIRWDDPGLEIDWPLAGHDPFLSDKDRTYPTLREIANDLDF